MISKLEQFQIQNIDKEKLFELAFKDPLTNIYNRRMFDEHLHYQVARYNRSHLPFAVFIIDADNFGDINTQHGHVGGDAVLKGIATRIQKVFRRDTDVVSRYGGDEFVVLITDILERSYPITVCNVICERLKTRLIPPYEYNDIEIPATVSIGVACYNGKQTIPSAEYVLDQADKALYQSKNKGKNGYTVVSCT